ncbi:MAG: hypothetical protein JNL80_03885 [Phycisphaerae bacterium]|jgi:hypothetical protein|nr:hypothetical protein [Phycisphaerae bacterium]
MFGERSGDGRIRSGRGAIAIVLLAFASSAGAEVVTSTWVGGAGPWESARLWNPAVVPDNTFQTTYTVSIDPRGGASVTIDSTPTVDTLFVGASSSVVVTDAVSLTIAKGPLIVDGLIILSGASALTDQLAFFESTWIGGAGEIQLGPGLGALLSMGTDDRLTIMPGFRISGNGTIGGSNGLLTHQGLIEATTGGGIVLTMHSSKESQNAGVLRAKSAQLKISKGFLDNTQGLIASEQAPVVLGGGIIVGGQIVAESPAGSIRMEPSNSGGLELRDCSVIGAVTHAGPGTLWLRGAVVFDGTILVNDGAISSAGEATIQGPCAITLDDDSSYLVGGEGATLTLPPDVLVSGTGNVGGDLVNQTLVRAGIGEQIDLVTNPPTVLHNEGLIQANGGLVTAGAIVDNAAGIIEATNGGEVIIGGWVYGGLVRSSGGEIFVAGGTVESLTIEGDVTISSGTMGLGGTLVHHGDLTAALCQQIRLVSTVSSIEGEGTWSTAAGCVGIQTDLPLALLRLGPGRTIAGYGALGDSDLAIINEGEIIALTAQLKIDPPSSLGTFNQGLLWAKTGNLLLSSGPFLNVGTVIVESGRTLERIGSYPQNAGTTLVRGTLTATSNVLSGGRLEGNGQVVGPLTVNDGVLHPGDPVGTLVTGSVTLGAAAAVEVEVHGAAAGQWGKLAAGGVTLGGTLRVSVTPGTTIPAGTILPIIQGTLVTGTFSSFETCAPISLITSLTTVSIKFNESVGSVGDLNGDGAVGVMDLALLLGAWGPADGACELGDLTGDGLVGPSDLSLLLANWS